MKEEVGATQQICALLTPLHGSSILAFVTVRYLHVLPEVRHAKGRVDDDGNDEKVCVSFENRAETGGNNRERELSVVGESEYDSQSNRLTEH